jgi:hypothetical protein
MKRMWIWTKYRSAPIIRDQSIHLSTFLLPADEEGARIEMCPARTAPPKKKFYPATRGVGGPERNLHLSIDRYHTNRQLERSPGE